MQWIRFAGWTREDLIQAVVAKNALDQEWGSDALWAVVRHDGEARIICFLLVHLETVGWSVKLVEEAHAPRHRDCPLRFLTMTPVKCPAWRANVLQYHAARLHDMPCERRASHDDLGSVRRRSLDLKDHLTFS